MFTQFTSSSTVTHQQGEGETVLLLAHDDDFEELLQLVRNKRLDIGERGDEAQKKARIHLMNDDIAVGVSSYL